MVNIYEDSIFNMYNCQHKTSQLTNGLSFKRLQLVSGVTIIGNLGEAPTGYIRSMVFFIEKYNRLIYN